MRQLLLCLILLAPAAAMASDAGACYSIQDPDARAYCLAKARNDPGTCYTIHDGSLRSLCLAEVRK